MEAQLELIRDQQRETWNKFSSGWKKWDEMTMSFAKPMGDGIIEHLHLKETDHVLDVAGGTGEPALTIAGIVTVGKVTCIDLSPEMLKAAEGKVKQQQVKNVELMVADVTELPFEDNSFDAVSCRFGFMFFPDMQRAAAEMVRVLKPGGRLATTVWAVPGKNYWVTAIMGPIQTFMQLPAPQPGAPGMFRCAAPGLMVDTLTKAGLTAVEEQEIISKMDVKTVDFYWSFMNEVAAPVVDALSKADEATRKKIKDAVYHSINEKYAPGEVTFDASALIIYGKKPTEE